MPEPLAYTPTQQFVALKTGAECLESCAMFILGIMQDHPTDLHELKEALRKEVIRMKMTAGGMRADMIQACRHKWERTYDKGRITATVICAVCGSAADYSVLQEQEEKEEKEEAKASSSNQKDWTQGPSSLPGCVVWTHNPCGHSVTLKPNQAPTCPTCHHRRAYEKIDHPSHYSPNSIEVIDAVEAWQLNFSRGSAVKYIARAGKKPSEDELDDLKKAKWYVSREIDRIEKERAAAVANTVGTVDS